MRCGGQRVGWLGLTVLLVTAGCTGGAVTDGSVTAATERTGTGDGGASVAVVTVTAEESVRVEILVERGEGGAPAITFSRTVRLAAGETYRIAIPAIPDTDSLDRDEDRLVVRTTDGSRRIGIDSCRAYEFTVRSDEVVHTDTGRVESSGSATPTDTVTEGVGTEPPTGQCE